MPNSFVLKCSSKGCKAPGKRDQPFDFAPASGEGKMRSPRSLHEGWSCITLKRPRTSWGRPHSKLAKRLKGGPNVHQGGVGYGGADAHQGIGHGGRGHLQHALRNQGKETLMESGLIQKCPLYCESYESSSLSLPSNSQEKVVIISRRADSSSSSVTNMGFVESSASLDNCSSCGDGFSSDEVMSLVDCSEMEGVLDFMASTMYAQCTAGGPDTCEKEGVVCGTMESNDEEEEEEDGEPYRIDLCDFEPDLTAPSCTDEQQPLHGSESGVLCLRLDYEEVLSAWKDGCGCLWAGGTPPFHPITLDAFHTSAHAFPQHPSYCYPSYC